MPTAAPDRPAVAPYSKTPGTEPIPGYVLLEPLGRGGFGEVWKCEAPGGLHKAVKFVAGSDPDDCLSPGGGAQLRQEFEAFQQVKAIRHPYLLCLERVELVGNELVMVMGLADMHLGDRFQECRRAGLPGVPRDELLGYLREAAEALDVIGARHGLQHLDVKPQNLFLTAGHVQVGDYGLVSKLDGGTANGKNRGLTPKYAAPEVLRGQVHSRSDQYSLALVYHELLTGGFPFAGRTAQQIMLQHASAAPDLGALAAEDRGPVAAALAKEPEARFPSCLAFVAALAGAGPRPAQGGLPGADVLFTPAPPGPPPAREPEAEPTQRNCIAATAPARPAPARAAGGRAPAKPADQPDPPPGPRLAEVLSVLPVEWLRGREAPAPELPPESMVRAVLAAASARAGEGESPAWGCRFLSTVDPRVAKVKLDLLWERGRFAVDAGEGYRVVARLTAAAPPPTGLYLFGKKPPPPPPSGLEVVVQLPEPGRPVGEVVAEGRVFGAPPADFALKAERAIVSLLEGIQKQLGNFSDRRKHPRFAADFPVVVFPMHRDGRIDTPQSGRCRDVSAGGLALRLGAAPATKYAYVAFEGVRGTAGLALLVQVLRTGREEDGVLVTGRFRTELWRAAK
jgi:serine/threonine protein kinase